jgi:coenzyme F420-dependent glucose-6-phosphate dehydrogenase
VQLTVCVANSDKEAWKIAYEWWPNAAIRGELGQELPLPRHFEQAALMVTEEDVADAVVCRADPDVRAEKIKEFADAGFDHVHIHQVGANQDPFFDLYEQELLPALV